MKWVYSIVLILLAVVVFVLYFTLVARYLAPVAPVHHAIIHSGIGNALCTPSYVCSQEF